LTGGIEGGDEHDRGRYRIVFDSNACIGSGKCAEVSENWTMDLGSGLARPGEIHFDDVDLGHNAEAARVCPANNGDGAIRIVDTRTVDDVPLSDEDS